MIVDVVARVAAVAVAAGVVVVVVVVVVIVVSCGGGGAVVGRRTFNSLSMPVYLAGRISTAKPYRMCFQISIFFFVTTYLLNCCYFSSSTAPTLAPATTLRSTTVRTRDRPSLPGSADTTCPHRPGMMGKKPNFPNCFPPKK